MSAPSTLPPSARAEQLLTTHPLAEVLRLVAHAVERERETVRPGAASTGGAS